MVLCRPAWDEIVALRAVNGFSPWVLGFDGVRRFLRRIFGGAANRPEIIEPAGRLATAVMAVGVAAASAFTAPAAAAAIVRPPTDVPNNAAVTSLDHAASQAAVAGAPVKAKSSKPPQGGDAVVDSAPAGGTTHSGGATHVEGRPPVGGTRLGVIVCPPDADDCIEG
jgi:hypothetical protein